MSIRSRFIRAGHDFLSAVEFLTRVPVPSHPFEQHSLARSLKYFPLVGLLIGSSAALLHTRLIPHLSRMIAALLVITFVLLLTGCLHEDGLADAADGFGGGSNRERILLIMRDSRIGSYGAVALLLSVLMRLILLSTLPLASAWQYLIAAHILCRWTTLPLSCFLPAARATTDDAPDGQGARVARLTTQRTLIVASLFTLLVVTIILRLHAFAPILLAAAITLLSGLYYMRRIGGVTGDCFGATNQLTEIVVYLCGVWIA